MPRKSIETSGSSHTSRIPLSGPAAAARKALFSASTVTGFSAVKVKSTSETSVVGTRTARPSSFPLSCGKTSAIALAAPVEVGIIETPAARARRRSLCGRSRMRWSLV